MAAMDLVIRRARRADKRDVFAAVRTLWGGHDRIPAVFDGWVTHRTGPFFVAESAGHVVGMGKLTVVSPTEGWLEGGRVAPRWRRKGIATALIAHRIAYAQERGLHVLRFSTSSDNTPIHRTAKTFGFRRVASLAYYGAPAQAGSAPARVALRQERAVRRRLGHFIQRGRGWQWNGIEPRDIRLAIARGRAFVSDERVGAAAVVGTRDDETLPVIAIGGRARPLRELLVGLRAEAERRGLEHAAFYASTPAERNAARSAGYRKAWAEEAYLYEKRLRGDSR
jgi:GNAT superfamily N-acetyltransferase